VDGHGRTTLPSDYVTSQVQLGYAATAHGHQGDTVDVSLTLVTSATTHRSLYVGATRGRDENRLLGVADTSDVADARDVLERVLTNDRADVPAVAQRRALARQRPASDAATAEMQLERARERLAGVRREAEPHLAAIREVEATAAATAARAEAARDATAELEAARRAVDRAVTLAEPHTARITAAEVEVHEAERKASADRLRERFNRLEVDAPARSRGVGIPPRGR
jgi:hypothetical protein